MCVRLQNTCNVMWGRRLLDECDRLNVTPRPLLWLHAAFVSPPLRINILSSLGPNTKRPEGSIEELAYKRAKS